MANIFNDGGDSLYSVAPPPAPTPRVLRRQGPAKISPLVMRKLGPNHPIFRIMPSLRAARQKARLSPGGDFRDWLEQEGQLNQPPAPMPPSDFNPLEGMPTDLSGLAAQQWGTPPEGWHSRVRGEAQSGPGVGHAERPDYNITRDIPGDPREALMRRFQQAIPQPPPITSRRALQHVLQTRTMRRQIPTRRPVLPPRRPRAY